MGELSAEEARYLLHKLLAMTVNQTCLATQKEGRIRHAGTNRRKLPYKYGKIASEQRPKSEKIASEQLPKSVGAGRLLATSEMWKIAFFNNF